ncbi:alpha-2-macroglobulin family protein [Mesorhizobium sp. CAU 1732]|uniref:alpha-2-macroglobulin family protein n=1 Tax=Mesorhizobium sp. CAU 1732 TaxID=3140358 RepID=UPI0032609D84
MSVRAAHIFSVFVFLFIAIAGPASGQDERSIVTTENGDYFGFDLRTERDVTLDQCEAVCLADPSCGAFTYNTRAQWCFLKSDFSVLNPFAGAVAGKVVTQSTEPDIGAPPALAYVPDHMREDARRYRTALSQIEPQEDMGVVFLSSSAASAASAGNAREAVQSYRSALAIAPEDVDLWIALARAQFAIEPQNSQEQSQIARDGTSAAINAYGLARTTDRRAETLSVMGLALDRRELFRPALQAYEASLALVNDATVRAAYLDLKERKGFRVVNHTVDSDLAAPRVCVQFSEDLAKSGTDYASFVTLDDAAPAAVEASGQQICVEGLEHGKHYRVGVRQGLPAAIDEVIEAPVTLSIYVRDRAPTIRFSGENFVLPSTGRRGLPMVSVNTPSADLKLHRVGDRALADLLSGYQFLRQLDGYDIDAFASNLGQPVWEGTIEIANDLNKEVVTSFPVDEALPERKPGVYVLTAIPQGDQTETWTSKATQWFVVSDIGLSTYAGEDGLTVFARSLSTAKALAGTELQLLARNNEILGTATTDAAGRATFTPGLMRGTASMAPAVLTAAQDADDFVFLDMTRAGFDLSDRGVTGRPAPGAVDVLAWTERGIYRAGETVHVAALARDDGATALPDLPLTFIFTRPDGVEESRTVSDGAALGGHHVPLDLQQTAMRGTWTVRIHTDPKAPAVAQSVFLVEDFVPDRIEFDLTAESDEIAPGEVATLEVDGRYLYGAPASNLALEGETTINAKREWGRFPGFSFGLSDEQIDTGLNTPLDSLEPTDDDGKASFDVVLDTLPSTTQLLQAKVTVRMREGGGRAVERSTVLNVEPEASVLGIRPEFNGTEVPEKSRAAFRVIAVSPEGDREAIDAAAWTLTKIERNYQWYRSDNSWRYEAVAVEREVANGTVDIVTGEPASVSVPVEWGRYRLDVESSDPSGPVASFAFDAGWFVEATSTETPDGLEIALDKESYEIGDVARLKVSTRFAGEMLVTIGSERLIDTVEASVPAEGTEIEIPVTAEWGAGAYVTATLYRPGDAVETRMPARAIGVKWLSVDPAERKLDVTLGTPERSAPREELSIPITVAGLQSGEDAYVMVAAVDVGILNLTGYTPPDPEGWYFGQRRLGIEMRDLYGRLIDGSAGAFGRIRTGGDGGGMATQGSPPTEKLAAFFEGPVKVGPDGTAQIAFDIPEFNGTARVMAVAWSKSAVGQANSDVVIRDPVVVTAGQPRFLATGDRATIRLDIHNTDGPAGDYAVSIASQGKAGLDFGTAPQSVTLDTGARATLQLPVSATTTGDATVTVTLAHADGVSVERTLFLPVRPPAMPQTSQQIVSLAPNGGSIRVDRELLGASILDGASVAVGVSPISAFDLPSMLMTLDRYPYGCAEQTISRALPLMYVSELSAKSGLEDDPGLRKRVQDAIARVMTFQSSSGSFGLWGPGYGDLWLDAYVTEFLTRAREQNYGVPVAGMTSALENLQNQLAYTTDIEARGTEIAYALYVLARNRKASVGDLRYYADTRIDEFTSPMARAQIAASLALYGDTPRAEAAFASAFNKVQQGTDENFYRSDYGSNLRDGAAILALAAETTPAPSIIPAMIRFVSQERTQKTYTSTQEEVWMLLAARAIGASGDVINLEVDGAPHQGSFAKRVSGEELLTTPITVANRGDQAVDAVITTVAAPVDPLPAGGDGFTIERTYYTLDGDEANVTEARQNDRFVVVLRVDELNDWQSRVAVTDLLPAGFEIDNPRLVGSAELSNFEWLGDPEAVHSEFRDDRFIAAFDRTEGGAFTVAYVVRAVTPGVYAHPAAVVEDMYRPQFNARTASGVMEVMAGQ